MKQPGLFGEPPLKQPGLFGEPPLDPARGQFHTPDWLADEMAEIAARLYGLGRKHMRILEPSVGGGALLGGVQRELIRQGGESRPVFALERIARLVNATVVEIDSAWLDHCLKIYPWVSGCCTGDFLGWLPGEVFDLVLTNPPYDEGSDTLHLQHMMPMGRAFVMLLRTVALHGKERSRIWAGFHVDEIVVLDERVAFTKTSGQIDVSIIAGRPFTYCGNEEPTEQYPRFRHL